MSPRAACRLDVLGFTQVFDYVPGKIDWMAHGLPVDGTTFTATIGQHLRHDVVTAALDDRVHDVRTRVEAGDHDFALVLAGDATLLGRLRRSVLDAADPNATAGQVMEPGPSTLRQHEPAAAVRDRLIRHHLRSAIVTDPEGHLMGTVHPADLT